MNGYRTPSEVARQLKTKSLDTLRRDLRLGRIQGIKVVRDWLIPDAEVERLRQEEEAERAS